MAGGWGGIVIFRRIPREDFMALVLGVAIGTVQAQSIAPTPSSLDWAYFYSACIAGGTQIIQILRADGPIRWRASIGEVLGCGFLGYAAAYGGATYFFAGKQLTVHTLLVIGGVAGWLGTNAITSLIHFVALKRFGVQIPRSRGRKK